MVGSGDELVTGGIKKPRQLGVAGDLFVLVDLSGEEQANKIENLYR